MTQSFFGHFKNISVYDQKKTALDCQAVLNGIKQRSIFAKHLSACHLQLQKEWRCDHWNGAGGHCGWAHPRFQHGAQHVEGPCGQGNADDVVDTGKNEVDANATDYVFGQIDGGHHVQQVILEKKQFSVVTFNWQVRQVTIFC